MPRPKKILTEELVKKAKKDLKNVKKGMIAVRLQAIISASKFPVKTVADVFGVTSCTIYNWILRYKESGVEGLMYKPRGHYPSKLSPQQKEIIFRWLKEGVSPEGEPIIWTLEKLQDAIKESFNVSLTTTPIWKMVRKMGFKLPNARPRHKKSDSEIQQIF